VSIGGAVIRRTLTSVVTLVVVLFVLPLVGWAQQTAKFARIGYLGPSTPALERRPMDAFKQRLRDLGYEEGRNLVIEYRWAEGHDDRLPGLAAELVRLNPDVIVTSGTPGAIAATEATKKIPIVMATSGDPVQIGLVASLAKPGGNVTGFTTLGPESQGKRLEFLKEAVPGLSRVAVLWNSSNPALVLYYEQLQVAAESLHVALGPVVEVRRGEDFERAFALIAQAPAEALIVISDRFLLANRKRIVEFATAKRLPGMYPYREYVEAGGLMSYAPSNTQLFRGAAGYVDKILRGAKPGELPLQQASTFELVVNLQTSKSLGLRMPPSLLMRADHFIE
jgi:ABC-type uncharacterized transport system substrate-binding protein